MSWSRYAWLTFLAISGLALAAANPCRSDDYPKQFKSWMPLTERDWSAGENPALGIEHAVILIDASIFDDSDITRLATIASQYRRVRVFDEKGIEDFQTVELPYHKKAKIKRIKARTIKPDGREIKVDKNDIHDKTLLQYGKSRINAKVFAFQGVEPGDILEYLVVWKASGIISAVAPLRHSHYAIESSVIWWFLPQPKIPSHLTQVEKDRMVFKPTWVVRNGKLFTSEVEQFPDPASPKGLRVVFMNVSALPDEPHMPPINDLAVTFARNYEFPRVDRENPFWQRMAEQFGDETIHFRDGDSMMDDWMHEVVYSERDIETDVQKCTELIRGSILNVDLAGDNELPSKIKENYSIDDLLERGYGTSLDINRLLVGMLGRLNHFATVFWTRDWEEGVFIPEWKTPHQFTMSGVAVRKTNGDLYCFPAYSGGDATSIPWQVCGAKAFMEDVSGKRRSSVFPPLQDLPMAPQHANPVRVEVNLALESDGMLAGRLRGTRGCEYDLYLRHRARSTEDQDALLKTLRGIFLHGDLSFDTYDEEYGVQGDTIAFACSLRVDGIVERAGARILCELGSIRPDHYVMPDEPRETQIDFHYPRSHRSVVTLSLPDRHSVVGQPADFRTDSKPFFFESTWTSGEDWVRLERDLQIRHTIFAPESAETFRNLFKQIYATDAEPLVMSRTEGDENPNPR